MVRQQHEGLAWRLRLAWGRTAFPSLVCTLVFSNASFEKRNGTLSPLTSGWRLGS